VYFVARVVLWSYVVMWLCVLICGVFVRWYVLYVVICVFSGKGGVVVVCGYMVLCVDMWCYCAMVCFSCGNMCI